MAMLIDMIMHRQEPTQTSVCVRRPAALFCACRSYPMIAPKSRATHRRIMLSVVLITICLVSFL